MLCNRKRTIYGVGGHEIAQMYTSHGSEVNAELLKHVSFLCPVGKVGHYTLRVKTHKPTCIIKVVLF